jgi:hypothetical protein
MVFETEQDAWIDIKNQTIADIADMEQQVKELNKCIAAGYDFLQRIDLKLLEWL